MSGSQTERSVAASSNRVWSLLAFAIGAQVVDDAQPEAFEEGVIGWCEVMERVGPEDLSPLGSAPAGGAVAAQVAEVEDAFEGQATFGRHQGGAAIVGCDRDVVAPGTEIGESCRTLPGGHGEGVVVVDRFGCGSDGDVDGGVITVQVPADRQLPGLWPVDRNLDDHTAHWLNVPPWLENFPTTSSVTQRR